MNRHSMLALLAASLGVAGTAAAQNATAPDELQIQSEVVRYDATEINDRGAAKDLFSRIRRAAQEVCGVSNFPRGYEIWTEHNCEVDAVSQAVDEASLPALDDYYSDIAPRGAARR